MLPSYGKDSSHLTTIYEVHFLSQKFALLSIQDVNNFITQYGSKLPDLLLNNMRIIPLEIYINSQKYQDAVNNSKNIAIA